MTPYAPDLPPAPAPGALKTREEYLLRFEERLLASLKDSFVSVNRQVTLSYAALAVLALISWQGLKKVSVLGADISLDQASFRLLAPIPLCLIMVFVNRDLTRIRYTIREIQLTSGLMTQLNPDSISIRMQDLFLFGTGVTGLILSLAGSLVHDITEHNPFTSLPANAAAALRWWRKGVVWILWAAVRSALILALLVLPCCGLGWYVLKGLALANPIWTNLLLSLFLVLLAWAALFTFVNSAKLFISYSRVYVESFRRDVSLFTGQVKNYLDFLTLLFPFGR